MLNLFTRTMPWMVASLVAATSIFGQSSQVAAADNCRPKPAEPPKACPVPKCPPKPCCEPVPQIQLIPAYNAPARVDVRGCWDIYAGASFIYWQAMQDNMEFAASAATTTAGGIFDFGAGDKTTAAIISHDYEYKPGFKILLGMNFDHDNWDGFLEYTWFNSNTNTSASAQEVGGDILAAGLVPVKGNSYLIYNNPGDLSFQSASQEWKLKFQALDAALARTYYVGTKLTFRSIFGARFAWFTQKAEQEFVGVAPAMTAGMFEYKQNFASWGAGLMGGLNTNWILGEGFSIVGNGSVDLLYTRVQTTNTKASWTATGSLPAIFAFPDARPDFLMPHMDIEFGFNWGSYFDCNNWHIDLAAMYGFQVFWNANLFRNFTTEDANGLAAISQQPSGNLYMHGLTISAKLDF